MKFLFAFIVTFVSIISCTTGTAKKPILLNLNDTLQTVTQFKEVVSEALRYSEDTIKTISENEMIKFVKIYNSIFSYGLTEESPYDKYFRRFDERFSLKAVKMFECEVSIGMGYYCPKYKLAIGGGSFPQNSYIVIANLQQR
jgi:hypothetical protein